MSKVIDATGRIPKVPTFEEMEREAEAREAADDIRQGDRYDASKLKDRALAINGALNTLDFVQITGREYWQVYGRGVGRESFYQWALKAQATINDIVAEHARLEHQP